MAKKRQTNQEESLFDSIPLEQSLVEASGSINAAEVEEAAQQDLTQLAEITDAAKEEADLEEVTKLVGASALPSEVQIAEAEDLRDQETMTDEELKRIEGIVGANSISRRRAEAIVLGEQRAANLNGEELPKPTSAKKDEKSSHPGSNPYKGSSKGPQHPRRVSSRLRGIGEEGRGKADIIYGPRKNKHS